MAGVLIGPFQAPPGRLVDEIPDAELRNRLAEIEDLALIARLKLAGGEPPPSVVTRLLDAVEAVLQPDEPDDDGP
jgi:hypothetical protein